MPLPTPRRGEKQNDFVSRCMSNETVKRDFGSGSKQAQAVCFSQFRKKKESEDGLFLEYSVPITNSFAELESKEFIIEGIAINETTTSNGHKFLGEELEKSAKSLIGVPLLKDHDNSVDKIVGRVHGAHFDEASRSIPFKATVKDDKMKQMIKDGLIDSVSVGAHVNPADIEETEDGDIIPHNITFKELSLVAVPADPAATFDVALKNAYKSHSNENLDSNERGDTSMTEEEKETSEEETKTEETEEKEEESKEETKEESKEEAKEDVVTEEKVKSWVKSALKEADADEKPEEEKKEEKEEESEEEEVEGESEEEAVEEKDYRIIQGDRSFTMEEKSYVYN